MSDLTTARGLDLFAGTGALGFELASRGAQHVTLVEHNQRLADRLQQLQRKLAADRIQVVAADALVAASRWPDASFDVIFVDPPYDSALLQPALRTAARLIAPDGLIYVEHRDPIDESLIDTCGLQLVRASRAGRVFFYLLRRKA